MVCAVRQLNPEYSRFRNILHLLIPQAECLLAKLQGNGSFLSCIQPYLLEGF